MLMWILALAWFPSVRILNRYASNRFMNWLHALTFELPSMAFCFVCHPLRWRRCRPTGRPDGRPILLIHGYFQDSANWLVMRKRLKSAGFGPIFTLNLGNMMASIETHAETVARKCREIEKITCNREIALVGHSMGGLVATWYATHLAPPNKVTHLVTLGSPFEGTHLARFALGRSGQQMRIGSSFSQKLNAKLPELSSVRILHVATETDELVQPFTSALPASSPGVKKSYPNLGHAALLFSRSVADLVFDHLRL